MMISVLVTVKNLTFNFLLTFELIKSEGVQTIESYCLNNFRN